MSDHKELRDLVYRGLRPHVGTVQILLADYDRLRQQCDELAKALEECHRLLRFDDTLYAESVTARRVVSNIRVALAKYREAK